MLGCTRVLSVFADPLASILLVFYICNPSSSRLYLRDLAPKVVKVCRKGVPRKIQSGLVNSSDMAHDGQLPVLDTAFASTTKL